MKFFLSFVLVLLPAFVMAAGSDVSEDVVYEDFKNQILSNTEKSYSPGLTSSEQKLYVDALWDLWDEGNQQQALQVVSNLDSPLQLSVVERLRLGILKIKSGAEASLDLALIAEIESALRLPEVDKRLVYIIASHEELLIRAQVLSVVDLASRHESYADIRESGESEGEVLAEVVTDLFFNTPDTTTYMGGEYINSVKIFMFCRANRLYPCLMIMRDSNGDDVRKADGKLWSQTALASARSGFPSYQRNGNTPAGIFTIDSVMPTADQQLSYGKFRRLILNFIPKSADEVLIKSLLPKSSHDNEWWKPTVVARDVGRNLFRIHGSGRTNTEPNAPYFPLNRTNGCIAQRENTYDGVTYQDQRNLLDMIMKSLGMTPTFANEPKIKGILYVVELGDNSSPVQLDDLLPYGIK